MNRKYPTPPTDLRIGNILQWVPDYDMYDHEDIDSIPSAWAFQVTHDLIGVVPNRDELHYEDMVGIYITEGILRASGAKWRKGKSLQIKVNDSLTIRACDHYTYPCADETYCFAGLYCGDTFTGISVQVLHQLQNLFYGLTGQELPIPISAFGIIKQDDPAEA